MLQQTVRNVSPEKQGFTLLEMSVVLVIIALIAGGLVVASSIIHNAEIQSVIADIDKFKKAAQLFKDKYHALPGDMPTATSIWGAAGGCPLTTTYTPPATCNGNGDERIDGAGNSPSNPWPIQYALVAPSYKGTETLNVFQHLANAKLIEGNYSNITSSGGVFPGVQLPNSKITGNGYTLFYLGIPAAPESDYYIRTGNGTDQFNYGHVIVYGDFTKGALKINNGGLTTEDAAIIDKKIDDGNPYFGQVQSFNNACVYTLYSAPGTTYGYNIDNKYSSGSGNVCSLVFITGF